MGRFARSMSDARYNRFCATSLRIYVASSWSNPKYEEVLDTLKGLGHRPYDFKSQRIVSYIGYGSEIEEEVHGKSVDEWVQIEKSRDWSPVEFRNALLTREACETFSRDYTALKNSDATVMVTPCGRSSHVELGIAHGLGQQTAVLLLPGFEPELMIKAADILTSLDDLREWAGNAR